MFFKIACAAGAPAAGVKPGAGGQLGNTGVYVIGQPHRRQAGAPVVEDTHQVAFCQPARMRIGACQGDGLAPANFVAGAVGRVVVLAVQFGEGLVGQKMQRVRDGLAAAQPFNGLEPLRLARAIRISEAGDAFAEKLYAPAGGVERVRNGVVAEILEHHDILVFYRQVKQVALPEFIKRRQRQSRARGPLAGLLIELLKPLEGVHALRKNLACTHAFGQRCEDVVVVACLADRVHGLLHGDHKTFARGVADVVALQPCCGRQHDVGELGRRCPELLVDDDGFRFGLPRAQHAVEVLVVVKGVAAGPVNQPDIRVAVFFAVVVKRFARLFQHVGDAGHGNEFAHRVFALRQGGAAEFGVGIANHVGGAVTDTEAAAGQPDLPQHGGQRDQAPEGLLTVVRTLQRPGHGEHGAVGGHGTGQRHNAFGRDAGDVGRPRRVLHDPVGRACEVGVDLVKAHAMLRQENRVVQAFLVERAGQRQDQRRVGVGANGYPLHRTAGVDIVADRADVDELHTGFVEPAQGLRHDVFADAARADLRIFCGHAAEADKQRGVLFEHAPAGVQRVHFIHGRHDVRHQHARRAQAVGVGMPHITAHGIEEAVHLALRVVKAPGAGPAVGTTEDRRVAVRLAHALQFTGNQVQRFVPRYLYELFLAAQPALRICCFAARCGKPAAPHGRPLHTQRTLDGVQHAQSYGRG